MHQKAFGSQAPPRPTGAAFSTPPDLLVGFRGRSRGREGIAFGKGDGGEMERKGRKWAKERKREEKREKKWKEKKKYTIPILFCSRHH